tara:strand:- start:4 stop:657 length:654 start_codon:yes stop_codon:yes gene_type:complete
MKLEINVPTSLDEITLGQYQKYLKIAEENPDGNFLHAKMIEIFCGIPLSDSYKLKVSSVEAIVDILNDLLDSKPTHVEQFVMNGVTYGFIPDLDDMSLGEYIDLDNNASKWEEMHVAMNVLYRPVKDIRKEKYNIVDYTTTNPDKMKDTPMSAVTGSLFFFLNLGLELSEHTILYSSNQEEMEAIQQRLTSEGVGGGINQFTDSLAEILRDLKISLN